MGPRIGTRTELPPLKMSTRCRTAPVVTKTLLRYRRAGSSRFLSNGSRSSDFGFCDIAKKRGSAIDIIQYNVDAAVVEQVAESRATRRENIGQPAAGRGRNFAEFHSVEISKQLRPLCPGRAPVLLIHARVDVPIRDEDVGQPVIVEIRNPVPHARKGIVGSAKPA